MLKVLEEDFARIPALLERVLDEPVATEQPAAAVEPEHESVQLGLF
jgi:hypothetical protein